MATKGISAKQDQYLSAIELQEAGIEIDYQGKGFPSLSSEVMLSVLRQKVEERAKLLIRYLDSFAQIDHTSPLRMSVTEEVNTLENMRLI